VPKPPFVDRLRLDFDYNQRMREAVVAIFGKESRLSNCANPRKHEIACLYAEEFPLLPQRVLPNFLTLREVDFFASYEVL
jgi:hypothetical protein